MRTIGLFVTEYWNNGLLYSGPTIWAPNYEIARLFADQYSGWLKTDLKVIGQTGERIIKNNLLMDICPN